MDLRLPTAESIRYNLDGPVKCGFDKIHTITTHKSFFFIFSSHIVFHFVWFSLFFFLFVDNQIMRIKLCILLWI